MKDPSSSRIEPHHERFPVGAILLVLLVTLVVQCRHPGSSRIADLASPRESVRREAAAALAKQGEEGARRVILAVVDSPGDDSLLLGATLALEHSGRDAVRALFWGLNHEEERVRIWSIVLLGGAAAPGRPLEPALERVLDEMRSRDSALLRALAIHARHSFAPPPSPNRLAALLGRLEGRPAPPRPRPRRAPDAPAIDDARVATALALVRFGPVHPAALPGLVAALTGPDAEVRLRAVEALGRPDVPSSSAGPLLTARLNDPDARVRAAAALALATLGEAAASARPALLERLEEADDRPRLGAAAALLALAPGDPELLGAVEAAVRRRPESPLAFREFEAIAIDDVASQRLASVVERVYGVEIVPVVEPDLEADVFMAIAYGTVDPSARFFHLAAMLRALARYPVGVIRRDLKRVWIVDTLAGPDGVEFGGTYLNAEVILVSPPSDARYTVVGFHHEFSSILIHQHGFPFAAWERGNPPDFRYGRGGAHAIRAGKTAGGSAALYRMGFFEQYGQADPENDVNTFSEAVLTTPRAAADLIREYPRLRAKWEVWIRFYHQIDPYFTTKTVLGVDAIAPSSSGKE